MYTGYMYSNSTTCTVDLDSNRCTSTAVLLHYGCTCTTAPVQYDLQVLVGPYYEYMGRACVPVDHIIMPCLATLPNCAHLTELKPRFRALKRSSVARLAPASPHTLYHQSGIVGFGRFVVVQKLGDLGGRRNSALLSNFG